MTEKHGALFVDKEDDDGVFPRLLPGRDEATVQVSFDDFYHSMVMYDLTNQWISRHGPFDYDITWLSSSVTPEDAKEHLRLQFTAMFGFDPETVTVLS